MRNVCCYVTNCVRNFIEYLRNAIFIVYYFLPDLSAPSCTLVYTAADGFFEKPKQDFFFPNFYGVKIIFGFSDTA